MSQIKLTNELYSKVIISLAYYLRGDLRFKYLKEYRKNLKKSNEEIRAYQLGRLKKLISHAYRTVPYYRELFDKNNLKPQDIRTLEDIKKIPPLEKKTVIDNPKRLKSTRRYKLIECCSGGSSGNRVVVFNDKRYNEISRAVWMRDLESVGIKVGQKHAWLWGSDIENQPLSQNLLYQLLWKINRRIAFNTFHYKESDLKKWLLGEFNRFKPDYIFGYSDSLYQIAKFIQKNKLKIHQVNKIISTAEKLEHREFIESVFKCKVIDHYGSREVLSIAIEDNNRIMHSSDDFLIVETRDNNEIMLTPLESYGMPLLRYVNGDIGNLQNNGTITSDNHPFNQFNLTVGRITELFRNQKNERVWAHSIGYYASMKKLDVGEFQVIQRSLDLIELNIIKSEDTKKEDIERLKNIIMHLLGSPRIKVNYLDKYPLEKSGKKINYKCLIQDE